MKATTILRGGVFPTAPGVDALAFSGTRIVAIGKDAELASLANETTRIIELDGKAVLPGFIDAHTHFLHVGLKEIGFRTDLSGLNRADTLARLAEAAGQRGEGEWAVGQGWDESGWQERRYVCREDLDRIAPHSPIIAARIDMHLLAANTEALARIPSDVDQRLVDTATGIVREEAAFGFLRAIKPDEQTQAEALHAAAAAANRLGITSVHTMIPSQHIRLYMRERNKLGIRVALCPEVPCLDCLETLGIESGFGDEWLRLGGVKLFADGSIGAGNAALGEPYADSGECGELNYTDEALIAFVRQCEQAGLQTVIHAIGDRAIEQVLDAHTAVGTSSDRRHRVEHFELPTKTQIDRTRDLGLHISMQPNFVGNWSGTGKMYIDRLGEDRDRQVDPHRLVLDAGLPLAFGSDCMPMSPLYGLHWAVNAPHRSQRVSVEEALGCYTQHGATLSFEEERKGRLDPGMLADLVILDQDPRQVPDTLADLKVISTIVGGEFVYERD